VQAPNLVDSPQLTKAAGSGRLGRGKGVLTEITYVTSVLLKKCWRWGQGKGLREAVSMRLPARVCSDGDTHRRSLLRVLLCLSTLPDGPCGVLGGGTAHSTHNI
jgi:hypothetical protein